MDFTKNIANFGKNISTSFTPFAARTQQFVREQLTQVEDKVSAPSPAPSASKSASTDGPADAPVDDATAAASSDTTNPTSSSSSPHSDDTAVPIPDASAASPPSSSAPGVAATAASVSTAAVNATANATASAAATARRLAELLNETALVFMIRRKLTETKTQLPSDYLELEKRVDALRLVHQQLLAVTSQFSNESYDYPPNYRESFVDLSRTITEKVQLLSAANTATEAQNILTKPGTKSAPKTFAHAIARASLNSAHALDSSEPLATALEKYALASEQVGEARLQQDAQIQSRFNAAFTTTLNTNIMFAQKARKNVENARLSLDAAKSKAKSGGGIGFPNLGGARQQDPHHEEHLTEEQRVEVETAEDEFVGCTEEAVGVMKNVLDTPEPLRNLADLVQAQLEFHKKAFEIYSELAPLIEGLQVEQEASYRKNREGGA